MIFELTEDHIKLLTGDRIYIRWQDCETGAPEIDPKRPYGNSDVAGDVAEILGWELELDEWEEMSEDQRGRALDIHHQTQYALQIILSLKTFEPGFYESDRWGQTWKKNIQ